MQTDLITKVYFNEHLTHSCVGMPQGLQALSSSLQWGMVKLDLYLYLYVCIWRAVYGPCMCETLVVLIFQLQLRGWE